MFRINQYNVTIVSQSRGKSQLVSELGPAQPQLVLLVVLLLVTGVKQSQLLDLSLGLGLEFDKKFGQNWVSNS